MTAVGWQHLHTVQSGDLYTSRFSLQVFPSSVEVAPKILFFLSFRKSSQVTKKRQTGGSGQRPFYNYSYGYWLGAENIDYFTSKFSIMPSSSCSRLWQ